MAVALWIASLLSPQDEVERWILQLGHEEIAVRGEAARRLQAMGSPAIGRLEKARDAAGEPEVKARIEAILLQIRKDAELAKALGPTRRVTIAARREPLKEILRHLHAPGVSEVLAGPFDEEARIDFNIRGATWWEALDRTARAVNGRYRIDDNRDGAFKVTLVKGAAPVTPVVYAEQFRISVEEAKRIEVRSPEGVRSAGLLVMEIRHQPDLKPVRRSFRKPLAFTAITDAKGDDARLARVDWASSQRIDPRPLSIQEAVWIRPDAVLPLLLTGTTDLLFPSETREVALDLAGDGARVRLGKALLAVESITPSKDDTTVVIQAESEEPIDLGDRMGRRGVKLLDAKGTGHPGSLRSQMSTGDGRSARWEFIFTSGIEGPRRIAFQWSAELYRVEIPFRLEGVRLPDFSR